MAGESIKPFGVDDLRDEFSGLEKRARAQYMPKAIRAGVDVLLDGMQRRVPQRTGRLHDSLRVEKLIGGGVGIAFKGAGFYVTDSRPEAKKSSSETSSDA